MCQVRGPVELSRLSINSFSFRESSHRIISEASISALSTMGLSAGKNRHAKKHAVSREMVQDMPFDAVLAVVPVLGMNWSDAQVSGLPPADVLDPDLLDGRGQSPSILPSSGLPRSLPTRGRMRPAVEMPFAGIGSQAYSGPRSLSK
jgi:hypothetical protein